MSETSHFSRSYLDSLGLPWTPEALTGANFTGVALAQLQYHAGVEAAGWCRAGAQSLLEAVLNFKKGRPSWGAVKAYYACFYAARARLLRSGFVHFYVDRTPAKLDLLNTKKFSKAKGNSHSILWREFSNKFSNSILLTEIDGVAAPHWIQSVREYATYRQGDFTDPDFHLGNNPINPNLANNFQAYVDDKSNLYTFDPDHAVLALPVEFLRSELAGLSGTFGVRRARTVLRIANECGVKLRV